MKPYGLIPTSILNWKEVRSLTSPHKLLFLVLFSLTNNAGVHVVDVDILALLTGLESGTIYPSIHYLADQGLLVFDAHTDEVFCNKFWSHNSFKSLSKHCLKDLEDVQSSTIKRSINSKIKDLLPKEKEVKQNKPPTPPEPVSELSNHPHPKDGGGGGFSSDRETLLEKASSLLTSKHPSEQVKWNFCFLSLLDDPSINNPIAVFKKRLSDNNFDSAGLYERHVVKQHNAKNLQEHHNAAENALRSSITPAAKAIASQKSAKAALVASKQGAL